MRTRSSVIGRHIALIALGVCVSANAVAGSDPLYRWVQLVPNAKNDATPDIMVKVIMDAKDTCPSLHVDKKEVLALTPTKRTKPGGFDQIQLCEARIPHGNPLVSKFQQASLNDQGKHNLPLPDLSKGVPLNEFIAFGCTGCRQDGAQGKCDDTDWAYPAVLKNAEKHVGSMPAVVAHLGDIRYADQKDIVDAWSLTGKDNTLGWQEEFFKPANDLLKNNWWIVMRGNHEACLTDKSKQWFDPSKKMQDRGAAWFYFFDDQQNGCSQALNQGDVMPAYALDATVYSAPDKPEAASTRLVVMDTVRTGDERDMDPKTSEQLYAAQFDMVAKQFAKNLPANRPLWVLTHIPMASLHGTKFEDTVVMDAINTSQLASQLDKASLTVAAHVHEFQLINPAAGNPTTKRPVQYVVGNGGVILSGKEQYQTKCSADKVKWSPLDGGLAKEEHWVVQHRPNFGYFLATFDKGGDAKLNPRFYDLKTQKWDHDKTVTCDFQGKDGEVFCSFLPKSSDTPKCP